MTQPSEIATHEPLAASCRAFALQTKPFGVARLLNDAADAIEQQRVEIERLTSALKLAAKCLDKQQQDWLRNSELTGNVESRIRSRKSGEMAEAARQALGKDA